MICPICHQEMRILHFTEIRDRNLVFSDALDMISTLHVKFNLNTYDVVDNKAFGAFSAYECQNGHLEIFHKATKLPVKKLLEKYEKMIVFL